MNKDVQKQTVVVAVVVIVVVVVIVAVSGVGRILVWGAVSRRRGGEAPREVG